MKSLNMKLALSALAIAMLGTPAFAQRQHPQMHPRAEFQDPTGNQVIVNGRYQGADPDANVRLELRKDALDSGLYVGGNS